MKTVQLQLAYVTTDFAWDLSKEICYMNKHISQWRNSFDTFLSLVLTLMYPYISWCMLVKTHSTNMQCMSVSSPFTETLRFKLNPNSERPSVSLLSKWIRRRFELHHKNQRHHHWITKPLWQNKSVKVLVSKESLGAVSVGKSNTKMLISEEKSFITFPSSVLTLMYS